MTKGMNFADSAPPSRQFHWCRRGRGGGNVFYQKETSRIMDASPSSGSDFVVSKKNGDFLAETYIYNKAFRDNSGHVGFFFFLFN